MLSAPPEVESSRPTIQFNKATRKLEGPNVNWEKSQQ